MNARERLTHLTPHGIQICGRACCEGSVVEKHGAARRCGDERAARSKRSGCVVRVRLDVGAPVEIGEDVPAAAVRPDLRIAGNADRDVPVLGFETRESGLERAVIVDDRARNAGGLDLPHAAAFEEQAALRGARAQPAE